jgi:hypothetical protein
LAPRTDLAKRGTPALIVDPVLVSLVQLLIDEAIYLMWRDPCLFRYGFDIWAE